MVIGVGGSEQGLQPTGDRSPTFRTGDNPLTLSDALVNPVLKVGDLSPVGCNPCSEPPTPMTIHTRKQLALAIKR